MQTLAAELNYRPRVVLPGGGPTGPLVTALVYEVVLEAPGIHTKRHFAGVLETHEFFSREAVHAALFDLWQPIAPRDYTPDVIPYASTPLVALQKPELLTLRYASSTGWEKSEKTRRGLTIGAMQAMAPGTRLRGAVWGDPAQLPDLFVDRAFTIGKRRAAVRVTRCVRADVMITTTQASGCALPIQLPREELPTWARRIAMRKVAETGRYCLVRPALDSRVPRFVLDEITVPALSYWATATP